MRAALPATAEVLGPVAEGDRERLLVTVPPRDGAALVRLLRNLLARRSAEGAPALRVQVDPPDLE